jgi:hypothetical protein
MKHIERPQHVAAGVHPVTVLPPSKRSRQPCTASLNPKEISKHRIGRELNFQGGAPVKMPAKIAISVAYKVEGAGGHHFRRLISHTGQREEVTVQ